MNKKIKIVYCLPSLYIPGGMERVLTIKANYFAEKLGYDIYIILSYVIKNHEHIIPQRY